MESSRSPIIEADALWDAGERKRAIHVLSDAIKNSPDNPHLWARRGWCRYQLKQYRLARSDFSEALYMKPTAATTLYFRAQCNQQLGLLDAALIDFRASVEIRPAADAHAQMGVIHESRGELVEARKAYERALALDPENKMACRLSRALLTRLQRARKRTGR